MFANAHSQLIAPLTAAALSALPFGQTAYAELLIKVDKSAQRMAVSVNGEQLYNWLVTTGGSSYDTPGGTFKPFRMEIDHYSGLTPWCVTRACARIVWNSFLKMRFVIVVAGL